MFRKLFVIMFGLALLVGFAVAEAHDKKKGELELRVLVDFTTLDVAGGTIGGAFYVTGDICEDLGLGGACTSIGTFHCWGWVFDAGDPNSSAVVSQEFNLDERGKIQVQGVEDTGPRAVVGGTGEFRKVRGEATGFDFSQLMAAGEFIATFKLEGVKREKDRDDD